MAETNTFTVDTSPQTETLTDNLTTDEQDSLAVGEKMVAEQEKLLALSLIHISEPTRPY